MHWSGPWNSSLGIAGCEAAGNKFMRRKAVACAFPSDFLPWHQKLKTIVARWSGTPLSICAYASLIHNPSLAFASMRHVTQRCSVLLSLGADSCDGLPTAHASNNMLTVSIISLAPERESSEGDRPIFCAEGKRLSVKEGPATGPEIARTLGCSFWRTTLSPFATPGVTGRF